MRTWRLLLLPFVIAGALLLVRIILVIASAPDPFAAQIDTAANEVSGQAAFPRLFQDLEIILDVNYGHDWVEGPYEAGHTIWITATEGNGSTVKGWAELLSTEIPWWGNETGFSTLLQGWQGVRPDMQAGDWVKGQVDNGITGTVRLGDIHIEVDMGSDLVYGTLEANWLNGLRPLRCEIWDEQVPAPVIEEQVEPKGGAYSCDFGNMGWDILPYQMIAVMYLDPGGHRVINTHNWPRMWAIIGPWSDGDRHVGGEYVAPGSTVVVTVTTELDEYVASVQADQFGHFETGEVLPAGALAFWSQVTADFGLGITDTLAIYPLSGQANLATDVVTVTAAGPPEFTISLQYCYTDQCDWIDLGEIGPNGQLTVDLAAERGFDIQPGTSFRAHLYTWNTHEVIYAWGLPDEHELYLPLVMRSLP